MAIFDVIKFEGKADDWLVYHFPGNNFSTSSQLIVGEGQVAVFVKGGRAMDFFSAGTYPLSTDNLPILKTFVNLPYGGKTPFSAEVYYINRTSRLDILWGTDKPFQVIDPAYNIRLGVRAYGQFGLRIDDYRVFLIELIGTIGYNQVVSWSSIRDYFKGEIVTRIKTILADIIVNQKISLLEITPRLDEISKTCSSRISHEFSRFGVEIVNFYVQSITFPDEEFAAINKSLSEKAAFDIIGDSRYGVKRSFDVMESAAGNQAAGGLAAGGMGLGMGAAAGIAAGGILTNSLGQVGRVPVQQLACRKCSVPVDANARFCPSCGESMSPPLQTCPSCNTALPQEARFCLQCGTSLAASTCSGCGQSLPPNARFCLNCGTRVED